MCRAAERGGAEGGNLPRAPNIKGPQFENSLNDLFDQGIKIKENSHTNIRFSTHGYYCVLV